MTLVDRGELLLRLARCTVEAHVLGQPLAEVDVPGVLKGRAGSFVTLKKSGELRGCIGTLSPTCKSLAAELVRNAIGACSRDPRFPPVRPDELPLLSYSVYVLAAPEPIRGVDELDPARYGVVVRCGGRAGVLLPGIPDITCARRQLELVLRKAGIRAQELYELLRFEVEKYPVEGD
ncbi:MAG: AmmeMemoRadiSam system protein A [Armatimonadetes bacterium]|nr:AmmeMemoRadiSam system protein A [Armatimonadota bacterium]